MGADDPFRRAALSALRGLNRRQVPLFGDAPGPPPPPPSRKGEPELTEKTAPDLFDRTLRSITADGLHPVWRVFADFCEMAALSLAQVAWKDDRREARYMKIVGDYTRDQVNDLSRLLGIVVAGLGDTPSVDFLGDAFQRLGLSSKWHGQFFTPMHVARLTAGLIIGEPNLEIERVGFVTLEDPACGAGAMLIAFAGEMLARGYNPQTLLYARGVDIDPTAAHMCYIQLSLYGIPAEVFIGNSLTREMKARFVTFTYVTGFWANKISRGYALGSQADPHRQVNPGLVRRANAEAAQMQRDDEDAGRFRPYEAQLYRPKDEALAELLAEALYADDPLASLPEADDDEDPDRYAHGYPEFEELSSHERSRLLTEARKIVGSSRADALDYISMYLGDSPVDVWGWAEPSVYLTNEGWENVTWGMPENEPDYGGRVLSRPEVPGQTRLFATPIDADDVALDLAKTYRENHLSSVYGIKAEDWSLVPEKERADYLRRSRNLIAEKGQLWALSILDTFANLYRDGRSVEQEWGYAAPRLYRTKDGGVEVTLKAPEGQPDYAGVAPFSWEDFRREIGRERDAFMKTVQPGDVIPVRSFMKTAMMRLLAGQPPAKAMVDFLQALETEGGGPFDPKKAGLPEPFELTGGEEQAAAAAPVTAGTQSVAPTSDRPLLEQLRQQRTREPLRLSEPFQRVRRRTRPLLERIEREMRADLAREAEAQAQRQQKTAAERAQMEREHAAWMQRSPQQREQLTERAAAAIQRERELAKLSLAERRALVEQERAAEIARERKRTEELQAKRRAEVETQRLEAAMKEIEAAASILPGERPGITFDEWKEIPIEHGGGLPHPMYSEQKRLTAELEAKVLKAQEEARADLAAATSPRAAAGIAAAPAPVTAIAQGVAVEQPGILRRLASKAAATALKPLKPVAQATKDLVAASQIALEASIATKRFVLPADVLRAWNRLRPELPLGNTRKPDRQQLVDSIVRAIHAQPAAPAPAEPTAAELVAEAAEAIEKREAGLYRRYGPYAAGRILAKEDASPRQNERVRAVNQDATPFILEQLASGKPVTADQLIADGAALGLDVGEVMAALATAEMDGTIRRLGGNVFALASAAAPERQVRKSASPRRRDAELPDLAPMTAPGAAFEPYIPDASCPPATAACMDPDAITADPARFQFKAAGRGAAGVSDILSSVTVWDPLKAGRILVWRDQTDGKVYVVDGHHRLDLAKRLKAATGEPREIEVDLLPAMPAEQARVIGAIRNLAQGRGTAVDAAKILRGLGPDGLAREGLSPREKVVEQGIALTHLAPAVFDMVESGRLSIDAGAVIGRALPAGDDPPLGLRRQRAAVRLVVEGGLRGAALEEAVSLVAGVPAAKTAGLFGEEDHLLIAERAAILSTARRELRADVRIFRAIAREADRIERAGAGSVDKAIAKRTAADAGSALDGLSRLAWARGSAIAQLLNDGAAALHAAPGAGTRDAWAAKIVAAARTLSADVPELRAANGSLCTPPEAWYHTESATKWMRGQEPWVRTFIATFCAEEAAHVFGTSYSVTLQPYRRLLGETIAALSTFILGDDDASWSHVWGLSGRLITARHNEERGRATSPYADAMIAALHATTTVLAPLDDPATVAVAASRAAVNALMFGATGDMADAGEWLSGQERWIRTLCAMGPGARIQLALLHRLTGDGPVGLLRTVEQIGSGKYQDLRERLAVAGDLATERGLDYRGALRDPDIRQITGPLPERKENPAGVAIRRCAADPARGGGMCDARERGHCTQVACRLENAADLPARVAQANAALAAIARSRA